MKKILGLAVALGLCFMCTGCEVDDLKKEIENKKIALNSCETANTALNKKVQELIDKYSAEVDKLLTAKEKEILEV